MRRGFTLIEVVIYFALSLMLLGVAYSAFVSGRLSFEATSSSYLVSQDAEAALRWLREDIEHTALMSIRVFPNKDFPDAAPGISMVTAKDSANNFTFTDLGTPNWSGYLYYNLSNDGVLTRTFIEEDLNGLAQPSKKKPEDMLSVGERRVVLRNLASPDRDLSGLGKLSNRGGFDFQFVRYSASGSSILSSWNPSQVSNGKAPAEQSLGANSRLTQLLLTVEMTNFRRSKQSYVQLPVKVCPRY